MTITETIVLNKAADPSRTSALRNAFVRAMRMRFSKLRQILSEVIVEDNVFGLAVNRKPGPGAFNFPRSSDKVAAFMKWLAQQVQDDILQITQIEQVGSAVDAAWTNLFIRDAYKQGITRARVQLRRKIPSLVQTGGIDFVLLHPKHTNALGLLYVRAFLELKGITDKMIQEINRIVAEGVRGDVVVSKRMTPIEILNEIRKIIKKIGDTIAEVFTRSEVIRAHAEGQLQEFENWGVPGVSAKAEILTAGDERVCPKCIKLEKQIFTIEEAKGIIPVHPRCRCIWIPIIEK